MYIIFHQSRGTPFSRILVTLLILSLVFQPLALQAQSGRSRKSDREEDQKKPRKRPRSIFSQQATQEDEKESTGPQRIPAIDVTSISKAAYDAIIKTGLYIVGPGDVFTIVLERGEDVELLEIPVGVEGELVIPHVGAVPLAGLTISEVHGAIDRAIRDRFQYLGIEVTLTRLRIFTINVIGEVYYPGAYPVNGVEQVSELIYKAGGLLEEPEGRSSLRNIQIQRIGDDGHLIASKKKADLYLWNLTGRPSYNPFILDGDQILVPSRGDSISVSGAIRRPGSYEYAPGDRISDLIAMGGGMVGHLNTAKAELLRLNDREERLHIELKEVLSGRGDADLALHANDKLNIEGLKASITIIGEVRHPGAYPIESDLTLKELIERAGGFTSEASLQQATVVRHIEGAEETDSEIDRRLNLPSGSLADYERAYLAMKTQQVQGRLPVDFVALFEHNNPEHNIRLRNGDVVKVPRLVPFVNVSGYVISPAEVPYKPGYTVQDYIERAGGFNDRAKKSAVFVIKARTGNWVLAQKIGRIDPGDEIFVQGNNPGEGYRRFKETLAIVSQIATLIFIIRNTAK